MVKDIIKRRTQTRLLSVFTPQSVLETLYDLQDLSYAAFWVFSREGENKRSSFL